MLKYTIEVLFCICVFHFFLHIFATKKYITIKNLYIMENFNEIISSGQLTLVDFFATWCGPCKMMHPVLEELKDNLGDSIRIIKLDVDKNESLCDSYDIRSVPTLMLFKNGQTIWRKSGAMSLNDLKTLINQYL